MVSFCDYRGARNFYDGNHAIPALLFLGCSPGDTEGKLTYVAPCMPPTLLQRKMGEWEKAAEEKTAKKRAKRQKQKEKKKAKKGPAAGPAAEGAAGSKEGSDSDSGSDEGQPALD